MDFDEFARSVYEVLRDATLATLRAAEDITGTMVVRVDESTLASLDQMVNSQVVQSRADGLRLLLQSGLKAEKSLFERIRATEERIREMKKNAASS